MFDGIADDFVRFLVIAVAASLLFYGVRHWAPKAGARRLKERGSIIGPPLRPTFEEEVAKRTPADLQNLANRRIHDDMLADAVVLKRRARSGTLDDRRSDLGRAISKVEDALTARPESYDGTKLLAELHLDRGLLVDGEAAIPDLEQSAQLFTKAASFRLGVIDNYIGRGWAYLRMTQVDPEWAAPYATKAAAAFADGFPRAKQNVWLMRGWGLAVDRYARAPDAEAAPLAELESTYRAALGEHRGGQHDLYDWFSQARRAAEPVWVDVPPLRDL